MSESVPAAPAGGESAQNDFADMVENLGLEGHAPDQADTSDGETALEDSELGTVEKTEKIKVNGKELALTPDELKKAAQMYYAGQAKLDQLKKEVAQTRELQAQLTQQQNAVRQLVGVVKACDLDTISDFARDHLGVGAQFEEAIIKRAIQLYEYHRMTPEQQEAIQNKKLVARMKTEAETRAKQDQERAYEYKVNQFSEHIATELPKAITAVGLPDVPFVREQIVSTWRTAIERGQTPTAAAVAAHVKQRFEEAKLNLAPRAEPVAPVRRRATPESVGRKLNGTELQGYITMSEWQKSRGRGR